MIVGAVILVLVAGAVAVSREVARADGGGHPHPVAASRPASSPARPASGRSPVTTEGERDPLDEAAIAAATSANVGAAAAEPTTAAQGPTWVALENARPGTSDWNLTDVATGHEIEGFADAASVDSGGDVGLHVSTTAPSFVVEAYRMGWYGGTGGRKVWASAPVPGSKGNAATVDPVTHMVEAPWPVSLSVATAGWPTGFYLLKLVASTGKQHYVPLIVRDDASTSALLVQDSVTTWQAYNQWGGYSLYYGATRRGPTFEARARVVSFDRPYDLGDGGGDLGNEFPLIERVERLGLDVSYWTDVDLHARPELARRHRALISLGHDEYWSTAMRDGATAARDAGVNLAFLGANAVYRHIRLEPSPLGDNRREVDYKSRAEDPMRTSNPGEVTVDWREPPVNKPEAALIGQQYECNPVHANGVVVDAGSWLLEGTGLHDGDQLEGLVGTEYDRVQAVAGAPPNVELLFHSPLTCGGKRTFADVTYYSAASGAGVFATGSNWWVSKLNMECAETPCVRDAVTRITDNVLTAFARGPAGADHPSVPNAARFGIRFASRSR